MKLCRKKKKKLSYLAPCLRCTCSVSPSGQAGAESVRVQVHGAAADPSYLLTNYKDLKISQQSFHFFFFPSSLAFTCLPFPSFPHLPFPSFLSSPPLPFHLFSPVAFDQTEGKAVKTNTPTRSALCQMAASHFTFLCSTQVTVSHDKFLCLTIKETYTV